MKKNTKRVLALLAAATMSCTMVTAWANTAAITQVDVCDTNGAVLWSYDSEALASATINADSSNLVKIYTMITDGAETPAAVANAESTFLSHLSGATTLNNENIQFLDQQPTNANGVAVYTFRPRTNYTGTYVAKTSGEGVTAAASQSYTVGSAAVQLTLAGSNNNVEIGSTADLVFTFTVPTNAVMPESLTSVKIGEADATYTYDKDAKTLTLTSGYPAVAGQTYTVTVTAAGYTINTVNYVVKEEEKAPIVPGDEEKVEEGVKDSLVNVNPNPIVAPDTNKGTVTLPNDKISGTGTEYEVKYDLVGASSAATINNNVVTYDFAQMGEGVIAETVTVKASVGDKSSTKKFYFVKPGVELKFGNINAVTTDSGKKDAFASQEGIQTVGDADVIAMRAEILNIVYNQDKKDEVVQWSETLDYDRNGTVTLAEYYIIKRMFDEKAGDHDVYNITNITSQRPAKTN